MNKLEKYIEKRIDIILREFNYEKRKLEHPEECPGYISNPCHEIKELNCFFCYCPYYDNKNSEGGCKINNPMGKGYWFERKGHKESEKIWDCSFCTYPHEEKNIREILRKLFKGELS